MDDLGTACQPLLAILVICFRAPLSSPKKTSTGCRPAAAPTRKFQPKPSCCIHHARKNPKPNIPRKIKAKTKTTEFSQRPKGCCVRRRLQKKRGLDAPPSLSCTWRLVPILHLLRGIREGGCSPAADLAAHQRSQVQWQVRKDLRSLEFQVLEDTYQTPKDTQGACRSVDQGFLDGQSDFSSRNAAFTFPNGMDINAFVQWATVLEDYSTQFGRGRFMSIPTFKQDNG